MFKVFISFLAIALITAALSVQFGISRSLAAIGPMLAAFGAALLAYDVLRGPLRSVTRQMSQSRVRLMRESILRQIERYRELPDNTHADAKARWISEAEASIRKMEGNEDQELKNFELDEATQSLILGLRGLALIFVGSAMQAVSAVLTLAARP